MLSDREVNQKNLNKNLGNLLQNQNDLLNAERRDSIPFVDDENHENELKQVTNAMNDTKDDGIRGSKMSLLERKNDEKLKLYIPTPSTSSSAKEVTIVDV